MSPPTGRSSNDLASGIDQIVRIRRAPQSEWHSNKSLGVFRHLKDATVTIAQKARFLYTSACYRILSVFIMDIHVVFGLASFRLGTSEGRTRDVNNLPFDSNAGLITSHWWKQPWLRE